jgi:hypothetical protein
VTSVRGRGRPDLLARLRDAVPLLSVYFGLAALYAWQAARRPVPTIFTDELELTQLSRAIADTGRAARRGAPYPFGLPSLEAYVLAPVWWLGTVSASYATAKLVLVLAMTATIFPAYALARLVVSRWYALAAAGGAVAVPALAYSPIFVEEPLAYPLSTLALWLIARTLVKPSWSRVAVATLACAIGTLTRSELRVLFAVLAVGLLWLGWESEPARRWRGSWTGWDWAGAAMLFVGFVLGFMALMGHLDASWAVTNAQWKGRIFHNGVWAVGALAIGIGILPLLAGTAALVRPRREPRDPETRAFVVTSAAALVGFIWYAAIKGAYVSTTFATIVAERNVIYLCPVLFAATALAIARGVGRGWAIAGSAIFTFYVVRGTPLHLDQYPYYEAHGLSIAAFANREWGWPQTRIEHALLLGCAISLAVVVALRVLRSSSTAFRAVAGTAAVAVLVWSLTAEVYAAQGERRLSDRIANNLPEPYNWVEQATGGKSVVVLGQQFTDATGEWLTEFWNPAITKVWSIDGTAPPPGPVVTPNLAAPNGTLWPTPGTAYALAMNGVTLQAPVVAQRDGDILYRLDGKPLRLASAVTGLYSDGWMGDHASYNRYDVSHDGPGFAVVNLSRVAWCGKDVPGKATVEIGPVTIGPDKQPAIAHVTATQTKTLHHCTAKGFLLPVPNRPWRVEITIEPTFSPHDLDPSSSDRRQLGAVVSAGFQPLFSSS